MIRGRFDADGRPCIDCIVAFQPIERLRRRRIPIPITFLVDTGADTTLIVPEHYEPYQYGDFVDHPLAHPEGYGGSITVRLAPASLHFRHDDGSFVRVAMQVEVARPHPRLVGLPSVLGRDLLDLYRLIVDRPASLVALDASASFSG